MKVALVTLCLNEMEFLPKNYIQHKNWPGLCSWVFVEGADRAYAKASPDMVTHMGLSVDGTSVGLERLATEDRRIQVIHHGFMNHADPAQAKVVGRNCYMKELEKVRPDVIIQIDADEFYTEASQAVINKLVFDQYDYCSWRLKQRHIWLPPSLQGYKSEPLEVIGGYWKVEHVRIFKWRPGICYNRDHNRPEVNDHFVTHNQYLPQPGDPECIHYGFAKSARLRSATHKYYVERGEGQEPERRDRRARQMYVECRQAWERWEPGDTLPHGAQVIPYDGPVPEVYSNI